MLPVMEHMVPSGTVAPVAITSITSPGFPDVTPPPPTLNVTVRVAPRTVGGIGERLGGASVDNAMLEVANSSSTINAERAERLLNLKHSALYAVSPYFTIFNSD
jgi:hypothetical protein